MSDYIVIHGIRIAKDFVPETFGRLTTLGPKFQLPIRNRNKHNKRKPFQVCECSCGEVKVVQCRHLRSGGTQSCGCLSDQKKTKHGLRKFAEYSVWFNMKSRCLNSRNKRYQDYGGRGIRVCERWLDSDNGLTNFIADMGPRPSDKHTIDRIDNDGDYCPENCRWATGFEQSRNKRTNAMLTHNGKTQCITDWAEELGISRSTLRGRLKSGLELA
jgi:hypothetical protein